MNHQKQQDETLLDRWSRAAKNNPLIAAIILAGVIISGVGTFWNNLPENWRVTFCISLCKAPLVAPPLNGWIWAGYLSQTDTQHWAVGPFVEVAIKSDASDRPFPIRAGDTVRILEDSNLVVFDFKGSGMKYVLSPPFLHESAIDPDSDYTGQHLKIGERYLVLDVRVGNYLHSDHVVWLRVVPPTHG